MKKKLLIAFLSISVIFLMSGVASAFLNNWQLDVDGAGGYAPVTINEYLDIVGPTYIDNDLVAGTFEEWGAFSSVQHDGGSFFPWLGDYELTGTFNGTGNVDLVAGTIDFTGGILNIYSDGSPDYATTTDMYGADNGTLIGTFQVLFGDGTVDPTGVPNGEITVGFEATYLAAGYWFDEDDNDLSDAVADPFRFVLGYSTTNASYVANPSQTVIDEIAGEWAGIANPANTPPEDLFAGTNGQYRSDVPAPAVMLLLGTGLIGLAGFSRKKFFKKG
jgi:hypothetical protein